MTEDEKLDYERKISKLETENNHLKEKLKKVKNIIDDKTYDHDPFCECLDCLYKDS